MTLVYMEQWLSQVLLYGFVSLFIIAVGLTAFVLWWEFFHTCPAAKKVRKAHNLHKPLVVLGHDTGVATFEIGYKKYSEGMVETKPDGRRGETWFGLAARKTDIDKIKENIMQQQGRPLTPEESEQLDKTLKFVDFLNQEATKSYILEGAGTPLLIGYQGKGILTKISHIFGLEALEKLQELYPNSFGTIDLTAIKTLFGLPWDSTQINNIKTLKFQEGLREGLKKGSQSEFKTLLLMLIVVFGLLVAAALILKFL